MKNSFIISFNKIGGVVRRIADIAYRDHLSLYAAQASFFIILSIIPFAFTLIALLQFLLPDYAQVLDKLITDYFPELIEDAAKNLLISIESTSAAKLVPITVITALWSASRGAYAIGTGIIRVYSKAHRRNYVIDRLIFLLYTVFLIVALLLSMAFLSFGGVIKNNLMNILGVVGPILDFILSQRYLIVMLVLTFFFCTMYYLFTLIVRKKIKQSSADRFSSHLPGAVFSSLGWLLFSYAYSLYIRFFPKTSYIYGSLAAIAFFLLWLYFCMMILLWGAEINKHIYNCTFPLR